MCTRGRPTGSHSLHEQARIQGGMEAMPPPNVTKQNEKKL
jgi:hypothetical protein